MNGGEVLLQCLEAQGVRVVFGMPGTQNLALYDAFHRTGKAIRHILVRDEQAATMMAGGFARASGEIGVALTVPGPGASNASTGIADAFTDCQPVLLVTGGVERAMQHRDRGKMFHGLDQASFFQPIVRYYGCPHSAAQVPQVVRAAFAAMWSGRPGPAVIEIPPDVAAEEAGRPEVPERVVPSLDRAPQTAEAHRAAELIQKLDRPAILAGGDVIASGATRALERLATRLSAPVLHTRLAKCALRSDHPLNLGNCRHKQARAVLAAADGLIAIGVRFTQIDTSNWKLAVPSCLVQIDRDPVEIGREYPTSASVVGDLGPSIEQLLEQLGEFRTPERWSDLLPQIQAQHQSPPVPVLSDIRQVLDRTGILACDITSLGYRVFDEYPVYGQRDLVYPCHYVTMGYGLPAALGAKVACPDRQVVALCGDGGVMMSIGELATAAQYDIGAVIVVVNDMALLAIKASQMKHYDGRLIDTELQNPDFVALAHSFGIAGDRARDLEHFRGLLAEALERGRPALIEVPVTDREQEIIDQIPWLKAE